MNKPGSNQKNLEEKSFASYGARIPRKDDKDAGSDYQKPKSDPKKMSFTLYSHKSGKYDSLKK